MAKNLITGFDVDNRENYYTKDKYFKNYYKERVIKNHVRALADTENGYFLKNL